jgi:prepilin-type processing-associated H-X9-DG protein
VGTYFWTGGGLSKDQAHWAGGLLRDIREGDVTKPLEWVTLGDFVASNPIGWPDGFDSGWTYENANWTNHGQGWPPSGGNYTFQDGHVQWIQMSGLTSAYEMMWPQGLWAFWYNQGRRDGVGYSGSSLRAQQDVLSGTVIDAP